MKAEIEFLPVYGRLIGVSEFYCPACGQLLTQQTGPRGPWVTQCTRRQCRRHWAIGLAIRPVASGARGTPPDTVFPPPRWVQKKWKANTPVNVLDET